MCWNVRPSPASARAGGDKRDQGRNAALTVMRMALLEREIREGFEAERAAIPEVARAETAFVVGDPVEELAERSAAAYAHY